MYDQKLEELIDAALEDGVLTEKEKQVLFKKAQAMGVDLDEFEMVLDARLVKAQKAEKEKAAQAQSAAPKSNKLGDVKKCPACGAMVQSFQGTCPECGYAFEGVDANSAIKELSNLLQKESNKEKMEKIIDSYPIPMDKATLLAFLTWLRPQSTDIKNPLANSYFKKYAECINKIRVSFANDKELSSFIGHFENDEKEIKKQRLVNLTVKTVKTKSFWIIATVVIILLWIIWPTPTRKSKEKTNAAVIEAINKGDLEKAEKIYLNFEKGKSYISNSGMALLKAYIQNKQFSKAEEFAPNIYGQGDVEEELLNAYLENKDYDNAIKHIYWGHSEAEKQIHKIVITLCENGEIEKAKKIIRNNKQKILESVQEIYGEKSKEERRKEFYTELQTIVNNH